MPKKHKYHLESGILTMVDLKIMDSQSFEYCDTGFVDVEGLTQLWVCCTVHPANLKIYINTEQENKEKRKDIEKDLYGIGTCIWSFRRNACSFLYSFEAGLLSPNVKLISQRWWANWLWKKKTPDKYSEECCNWTLFTFYIPQSCHWLVVVDQANDQEPGCKSLYCPEYSATEK